MKQKGWIALDIDGTITLDKYSVPREVTAYLRGLQKEGWNIAMATGRPFAFAAMALSEFDFPYTFLAQNGSLALEMPEQKLLFKKYMTSRAIPLLEAAYEGIGSDFLIYAGYEKGDFCYWRPDRFSGEDLAYLEELQTRQREGWREVERFDAPEIGDFPLIKCFGPKERMEKVVTRLKREAIFEVARIRDPHEEGYEILLVTDRTASKGASLNDVFARKGRGERVIAAGDDANDVSLFEVADLKIAMAHAPEFLRKEATFIAPPTRELGIIQALNQALNAR